jgi:hypothetical protein
MPRAVDRGPEGGPLEAALFVLAEQVLVEVLSRIRPADHATLLPAMYAGADAPAPISRAVHEHVWSNLELARTLNGATSAGGEAPASVPDAARCACAAAVGVTDGDFQVQTADGPLTARVLLLRAAVRRALLAHYVAAYLGSTACPLPEELARPLWELTAPDAAHWRHLGLFREPLPLPVHASWRDRFLLSAGHPPHPLDH